MRILRRIYIKYLTWTFNRNFRIAYQAAHKARTAEAKILEVER